MSARELSRVEVLSRVKAGTLSVQSAATVLGVSSRQAKRLMRRYRAEGAQGLKHRSAGRPSNHARPPAERERVVALVREKYSGSIGERFGPTLAAEHLASEDGVTVHHDTLRRWMLAEGLWSRARQRSPHRARRERKAHFGELVQLDGSFHLWYEDRAARGCLMNLVDDATGRTLARLGDQEDDLGGRRGVAPVDRGVRRAAGALYGLEECLCARADGGGTGDGGRAPDAVWADVRGLGDSHHRRELPASEGARRAQSRDASGSPREETAAAGDRGRDGGECLPGDPLLARAQPALRRGADLR